ncbi:helix-turn-helix domain-containing protein [Bradyrhizobium prioriisuperbiae]|uniref:TetR/AcrR family transcriptional regulator n=1 Tax=Bradyrhizobium prioriisuperbiae TaxID=2854389 RepID=UPI0028EB9AA4|nr:helix-turn-helix domain-containing protein [Bradyrhizobium prioritasuperba]
MPSQKSITQPAAALAPKRERGRQRVAAILDAGAAVFAEKGFDAATMTEIAARADTAIGSLYRFFPTKEVLADALLTRHWERLRAALDDIEARAAQLSPDQIADALIEMMQGRLPERDAVLAFVESRSDRANLRSKLRGDMRRRIAAILTAASQRLPQANAETKAIVLLHMLKLVSQIPQEKASVRTALLQETREAIRRQVASSLLGVRSA